VQFRLSAPTKQTIVETLKNIAKEENIKFVNERLWDICKYSQRDINLAINTLQHISLYNPSCLTQKNPIEFRLFFDKQRYFDDIIELLWSSKKQKDLMVISEIREKLYDLLVHCIEPIDILKSLFHKSVEKFTQNKVDEKFLYELTEYLIKYEDTMKQCSKPIYHLEGFIVSVFRLIHIEP
jgi:DNA polymerase III delta prime subunit